MRLIALANGLVALLVLALIVCLALAVFFLGRAVIAAGLRILLTSAVAALPETR
jgi:hypothetical protein